jgi:hypothetical protein
MQTFHLMNNYLTKVTNLFSGEGTYPGLVQSTCGYLNCSFQTQRPAHCCPVEVSILVRHYKSLSFEKHLHLHPSFIIKCSCTCRSRLCGAPMFHTLYSVICEWQLSVEKRLDAILEETCEWLADVEHTLTAGTISALISMKFFLFASTKFRILL